MWERKFGWRSRQILLNRRSVRGRRRRRHDESRRAKSESRRLFSYAVSLVAALMLQLNPRTQFRGVVLPKVTASKPLFSSCPSDITPPHFDPDSLLPSSHLSLPLLPSLSSPASFVTWEPPPPTTALIFPTFLLLPLATPPTRDLCLAFHTSATFGEVLLSMEHDPSAFNLYIATKKGRVLKVGAKLDLGKVLEAASRDGDGWELKEGWALEMVGVPKGSQGEAWVAGWKQEVKDGVKTIL